MLLTSLIIQSAREQYYKKAILISLIIMFIFVREFKEQFIAAIKFINIILWIMIAFETADIFKYDYKTKLIHYFKLANRNIFLLYLSKIITILIINFLIIFGAMIFATLVYGNQYNVDITDFFINKISFMFLWLNIFFFLSNYLPGYGNIILEFVIAIIYASMIPALLKHTFIPFIMVLFFNPLGATFVQNILYILVNLILIILINLNLRRNLYAN